MVIILNICQDESFHILIDLNLDMIQRWGTLSGVREGVGEPGEGTTIDTDEPFMLRWAIIKSFVIWSYILILRIECDPDGWTLRVNNDASLDTLYHFEEFPLDEIENVEIFGGGTVSYTGFGDKGQNNDAI